MSAANVAVVAGLVSAHVSAHPLWLLVCRGVARLPFGALALRLNALSAICGATAALLLGTLVARLLYAMAHEDAGVSSEPTPTTCVPGTGRAERRVDRPQAAAAASSEVRVHNDRAATTAAFGGALAGLAFAFSAACWSASTRLQPETFDAVLLLVAAHLMLTLVRFGQQSRAMMLACLCGAGCVESVAFIVSAPLFTVFALRRLLRTTHPRRHPRAALLLALSLSAATGALADLLLLRHLAAEGASDAPSLATVFVTTAHYHRAMLGNTLPHVGWIWIVLLAFMPAALACLCGRRAFQKRAALAPPMHLAMTLATVLCLGNATFSPWGQACASGRLPVMAYLAVAATAGYLFAYWRMLAASPDRPGMRRRIRSNAIPDFWLGSILMWVPVIAVCLASLANLSEASGRRGDFADCAARSVLAQLGERTWVASDGQLDNHLMLAAQSEGRALRVINLSLGTDPDRIRQIRAWIDADPRFALSRARMENAVALGAPVFLNEWLHADPAANQALFVVGAPEVWQRSGWQPVSQGYGFGGARNLAHLDGVDLLTRNRADWNLLARILAPEPHAPPSLERIRQAMCRQLSRSANDLGVLSEDRGRTNEALEAYLAADRFDRGNVCALLNLLRLPAIQAHPDVRRNMEKDIRALLDAMNPRLPILAIVQVYGEINQPDILAQCGRAWSVLGQPELARCQLDRATGLAQADDWDASHNLRADVLAVHGDTAAAGRAYRDAVARDANNATAMIGLASVCLCDGQTREAREWLDRARKTGADEPAWAVSQASLMLAEGQTNNALEYLRLHTDKNPGHMEAWALEADILLKQQALSEVEQQVLPAMRRACIHSDHFLLHVVRAHLLACRVPVDFPAMHAALLHALGLRRDLADVREELLRADIQSGNRGDLQSDAAEMLRFNPEHALANYIAGNILMETGELKRAEDHLRRSLATHASAAAFNDLAETLRRLKQLPEAEGAARAALACDPRCGQAWDTLGSILLDALRVPEAEKAIEQALALRAQDPRIRLNLARLRLAQGRPDECRQILHRPGADPDTLPADLRREIADLQRLAAIR